KMGIGRVLLIEQGKDIDKRDRRSGRDMLCGWGGAGAYSDGKLNLSTEVGGFLSEFIPSKELEILLREADKIYLRYGAPEKIFGANLPEIEILSANARKVGLTFVPTMIRHMGTENCISVLERMRQDLTDETSIKTECRVEEILTHKNKATGVRLADGQVINGHFVVAAPGRIGAGWMKSQADLLNLSSVHSPVDIGLRIEAPAPIMEP
ncbi:unnamed protein product, partial [marine sediment metagenome]